MKTSSLLMAAATLTIATPALAQTDEDAPFAGGYVGLSVGYDTVSGGKNSTIEFDRNLDGTFGETVVTSAAGSPNAFSPGFCNGIATTALPADGCRKDKDDVGYSLRAGYDWQSPGSSFVFGAVFEIGKSEIRDAVSAFSTTPANYVIVREIDYLAALRARLGFAASRTLFYGTGGVAYGNIDNSFTTTNAANGFTPRGKDDAWGYQLGAGVEHKFSQGFSVGVEFLHTRLNDDNFRVRAGQNATNTTPATNPFILAPNTTGTDFRRSDDKFRSNSIRAVANFRF